MARRWSFEENRIFIDEIETYRYSIRDCDGRAVTKVTRDRAQELRNRYPVLEDRSEQAVYEHLSYFDDLLAGVGSIDDYAEKDAAYFGTKPRLNGSAWNNEARVFRSPNGRGRVQQNRTTNI